jgi:hypothetical protein
MASLTFSLVMLNAMVMIVCLSTLHDIGPEGKNAMKLFMVEGFISFAAFSLIVLTGDKVLLSILCYLQQQAVSASKSREAFQNLMAKAIADGLFVRDGDRLFVSAGVFPQAVDAANEAAAKLVAGTNGVLSRPCASTSNVPVSDGSSQSGTPTFMPTDKEMSMANEGMDKDAPTNNEDACSAATTV